MNFYRLTIPKLIFFACFLLSYSRIEAQVKITGTITGGSGQVSAISDPWFGKFDSDTLSAELIAESFSISLEIKQPSGFTLVYDGKKIKLFAEPGDNIEFTSTSSQFPNDLTFTGKNAANNNFMSNFSAHFALDFDSAAIMERIHSNQLDYFETSIYENLTEEKKLLENQPGKDKFSPAFTSWIGNQIRFHYLCQLMAFPIVKAGNDAKVNVKDLPPIMLESLKPEYLKADDAFNSEQYRKFIKNQSWYFIYAANGYAKFTDPSIALLKAREYASGNLTPLAERWFLSFCMMELGKTASPETLKLIYDELSASNPNDPWSQLVLKECGLRMAEKVEKVKGKEGNSASGNKTYPFVMTNAEGEKLSFDDHKGKVIYVDFWASWCGPCRAQAPFAIALKEKLTPAQHKQIVFMYISIDEDKGAWQKAVEKLGLEGIHGISPSSLPNGAGAHFGIPSIPRYMIINQKGEIVNPNAPRPGDPAAYEELMKLLR